MKRTLKILALVALTACLTNGAKAQGWISLPNGDQYQADPYGAGFPMSVDSLNNTFTEQNLQSGYALLFYSFAMIPMTGDNLLISYELFNQSDSTFSGTIGSWVSDTTTTIPMNLTKDIAPGAGVMVTIPVVAGANQSVQSGWTMGLSFWGSDMPATSTLQLGAIQMQDLSTAALPFNQMQIQDIQPVPEPSTMALAVLGGFAMLVVVRRRPLLVICSVALVCGSASFAGTTNYVVKNWDINIGSLSSDTSGCAVNVADNGNSCVFGHLGVVYLGTRTMTVTISVKNEDGNPYYGNLALYVPVNDGSDHAHLVHVDTLFYTDPIQSGGSRTLTITVPAGTGNLAFYFGLSISPAYQRTASVSISNISVVTTD